MDVPAVRLLVRVVVVGIVVELTDFVPAVHHWNAALRQHPGMERQITGHRPLQFKGIALKVGGLYPAQGCSGTAQPGVSQAGIVVVQLAPGVAAREVTGKPVVEVALMGHLVGAEALSQPGIIQPPADIVVTAQIVEE